MFQRPRNAKDSDLAASFNDAEDTPRGANSAANPRMHSNFMNNKQARGAMNPMNQQADTHRNFKNLQQSQVSLASSTGNF